ncbi:MAG: outer membrane protein assembly factor BamA [Acidobacteria bacterium]|nr:outer membrane protein assembly factor BamA [Acidobacteriota bacterium]
MAFVCFLSPASLAAQTAPFSGDADLPIIEDIIFRGNRRIRSATLRARITSRPGDPYDEKILRRDFHAIWNTGFVDDIRLVVTDGDQGKIITFYLREKKTIRSIEYVGNKSVRLSDILERFKERKVRLSVRSQYDPVVVRRAQVVLEQLLSERGRMFARVTHRTRNLPPNSVRLVFVVKEGPKVKVGKVRFQGNTIFGNKKLVRAMKLSRPVGIPPWFWIFHKTYHEGKMEADMEMVRSLYQDTGYFKVLVHRPEVTMVDTSRRWPLFFLKWGRGKRVDVKIKVEEGELYRMGEFKIRGNKVLKQEQLEPLFGMKKGDIFNATKARESLDNFRKLYGEFGYINFTAVPQIDFNDKERLINFSLDFEEDKQFFVRRVEFAGNAKTRDKVIRRELFLTEGGIFSTRLWDISVLRVNQLGFFDIVKEEDYDVQQNNKDATVDILLNVKERGRQSIGFSGGVSGLAGSFVGVNYSTNNFLGLGETLSVQTQFGDFQKLYSFGFTEPYLLDRPITTGFTVFKSEYKFDQARQAAVLSGLDPDAFEDNQFTQNLFQNFQQNSTGFTVYASYPLRRKFARVGLSYSYSVSNMTAFSNASQLFFSGLFFRGFDTPNSLEGIRTSKITPTITHNTVNNQWSPTRGKYLFLGTEISGSFLGGNVNMFRPVVEFKMFRPIHKRNVLGFRVQGSFITGYGGVVAPPFQRFYIGGENDLRGFRIRSISPLVWFPTRQSVRPVNNDGTRMTDRDGNLLPPIEFPSSTIIFPGADSMLVSNFEYRIPILGPVTLAYFVDAGTSWVLRKNQLRLRPETLSSLRDSFPEDIFHFPIKDELETIRSTNGRIRVSTGLELQILMPVMNVPFRIYWARNVRRLDGVLTPPQNLPSRDLFPNDITYSQILPFFTGLRIRERKARIGFTVSRTF